MLSIDFEDFGRLYYHIFKYVFFSLQVWTYSYGTGEMQNPKETLASCLEIMSLSLTYVVESQQESSHVFEPKRAPTTKIDFFEPFLP